MQILYTGLNDFLKTFSSEHSVLWALLVMAVMASVSLMLYGFWEVVIKAVFSNGRPRKGKEKTGSG